MADENIEKKENPDIENKKENSNVNPLSINKAKEYDELNDRYMRMLAEFENYKKRANKQKDELYGQVTSDVIKSFLPIMDNLDQAMKIETKDEDFKKGIELIYKQINDVLTSKGVETIPTKGEKFDPELHEAVSMIDNPEFESQDIVEEFRKGYKIGDKVIRHSMVVVAN